MLEQYLVLFAIYLVDSITVFLVYQVAWWRVVSHGAYFLPRRQPPAFHVRNFYESVILTQCAAYFISSCVYRKHQWHTYSHAALRPPISSSG